MIKTLGEAAKHLTGDLPGLDLVVYGIVLIVVVAFAPRGVAGVVARCRAWLLSPSKPAESGAA
jgi:branched-chain amino acid transport system permease protein